MGGKAGKIARHNAAKNDMAREKRHGATGAGMPHVPCRPPPPCARLWGRDTLPPQKPEEPMPPFPPTGLALAGAMPASVQTGVFPCNNPEVMAVRRTTVDSKDPGTATSPSRWRSRRRFPPP